MVEHGHHSPEATRRIRALVRSAYSPAVWLMAAISLALTVTHGFALDKVLPAWVGPLMLTLTLIAFIYLTAGLCDAFARGTGPVPVGQAFHAAGHVFGSFLWLMVKASLIGFVLFETILMLVVIVVGVEPFRNPERTADVFTLFAAVVALVFVYWVPIVFVRRNFRLFETLGMSLRAVRDRPRSMLYLAALLWTPMVILTVVQDQSALLAAPIVVVGEWLRWAAYAYCVDVVAPAPAAAAPAGTEG